MTRSFPITAAGQSRIPTGFPLAAIASTPCPLTGGAPNRWHLAVLESQGIPKLSFQPRHGRPPWGAVDRPPCLGRRVADNTDRLWACGGWAQSGIWTEKCRRKDKPFLSPSLVFSGSRVVAGGAEKGKGNADEPNPSSSSVHPRALRAPGDYA